ncbi:unnamed protein product [Linum tenue]|uniref:C2H2-type domain-containing protein n=2 Tax=Linum tenue TaxID=586396 RepID=A0AAV0IM91_9ROSI|nr:unnamed protein product [Linum tenue]
MSSSMEFWGVEVKAGKPLKVTPEDDVILHLSHAALGEAKKTKESEFVPLFIKVGEKKLVLGTLSPETIPQLAFDLVLEQEFELSHNWKNGSIFFTGYKSVLPDDGEEFSDFGSEDESEDEEEEVPVVKAENGKVQKAKPAAPAKAAAAKPEAAKPKAKAAVVPAKPENESDDSDDDSEDDEDESSDDGEVALSMMQDMSVDAGADSDDDEDDSDDSEDEETPTPKKPEQGKKRSNDSAVKTPVPAKKAKQATPAKSDGKKAVHTATPHPAKNVAKTAGSAAKTPKSGGEFSCKSCDRSFGTDGALQSHAKAKHTAK